QALVRKKAHPVSGEPCEHILRRALQIGGDLVLEGAVVNRVQLHLGAAVGGREGVDDRLDPCLRAGVGPIAAQRHVSAGGRDAAASRRGRAAGGEEGGQAAVARDLEHVPPRKVEVQRHLSYVWKL